MSAALQQLVSAKLWSYRVLQILVILISASKADLKLKKASAEFFYTMFPAQAVQIYDISILLTTIVNTGIDCNINILCIPY